MPGPLGVLSGVGRFGGGIMPDHASAILDYRPRIGCCEEWRTGEWEGKPNRSPIRRHETADRGGPLPLSIAAVGFQLSDLTLQRSW